MGFGGGGRCDGECGVCFFGGGVGGGDGGGGLWGKECRKVEGWGGYGGGYVGRIEG